MVSECSFLGQFSIAYCSLFHGLRSAVRRRWSTDHHNSDTVLVPLRICRQCHWRGSKVRLKAFQLSQFVAWFSTKPRATSVCTIFIWSAAKFVKIKTAEVPIYFLPRASFWAATFPGRDSVFDCSCCSTLMLVLQPILPAMIQTCNCVIDIYNIRAHEYYCYY
jgi:hypothetical protein